MEITKEHGAAGEAVPPQADDEYVRDFYWSCVASTRCDTVLSMVRDPNCTVRMLCFTCISAGFRCISQWQLHRTYDNHEKQPHCPSGLAVSEALTILARATIF